MINGLLFEFPPVLSYVFHFAIVIACSSVSDRIFSDFELLLD